MKFILTKRESNFGILFVVSLREIEHALITKL